MTPKAVVAWPVGAILGGGATFLIVSTLVGPVPQPPPPTSVATIYQSCCTDVNVGLAPGALNRDALWVGPWFYAVYGTGQWQPYTEAIKPDRWAKSVAQARPGDLIQLQNLVSGITQEERGRVYQRNACGRWDRWRGDTHPDWEAKNPCKS